MVCYSIDEWMGIGVHVAHGNELCKTLRNKVIGVSKTVFKYEEEYSSNEAGEQSYYTTHPLSIFFGFISKVEAKYFNNSVGQTTQKLANLKEIIGSLSASLSWMGTSWSQLASILHYRLRPELSQVLFIFPGLVRCLKYFSYIHSKDASEKDST